MRPVLEELPVVFDQAMQIALAVGLVARKQDVVMGPLHGADAVDLDET